LDLEYCKKITHVHAPTDTDKHGLIMVRQVKTNPTNVFIGDCLSVNELAFSLIQNETHLAKQLAVMWLK